MKTVQRQLGVQNTLSDFYNILLERHQDDAAGYDVLYVDPIRWCVVATLGDVACGSLPVHVASPAPQRQLRVPPVPQLRSQLQHGCDGRRRQLCHLHVHHPTDRVR